MSSSWRAWVCSGVGVVRRVKVCSAWPMRTVLRQRVPRSASRSVRVWAGAGREVVVDRADLDRVLHRSERALGHLELLVGADRGRRAERHGGEGGADRVEAVQGSLAVDLLGLALVGERAVGDQQGEVLGDLVLV